jgi:hypothetical protein
MIEESNLVLQREQLTSQSLTNIQTKQFITNIKDDITIKMDNKNQMHRHNQHFHHVSSMTSSPSARSRVSSRSQSPVSFCSSSHYVPNKEHTEKERHPNSDDPVSKNERKDKKCIHDSPRRQHRYSPSQSNRYRENPQPKDRLVSVQKRSYTPPAQSTRQLSPASLRTHSSSRRDNYFNDHQHTSYSRRKNENYDEEDEIDRYAGEFTSICLKNLNEKVRSDELKQHVYNEFHRFGEFTIKIANNKKSDGERIVFLNFNNHKDAKKAKKMSINKTFLDYPLHIEPVFVRNKAQGSTSPLRLSSHRERSDRHATRSLSPPRRHSPLPHKRYSPSFAPSNSYYHISSSQNHNQQNYDNLHNFKRKNSQSPRISSRRSRTPPIFSNHNQANSRTTRESSRYDNGDRSPRRSSHLQKQFGETISRDFSLRRSRSPVQRHERQTRLPSPMNASRQRHNDYHSNYQGTSRTNTSSLSETTNHKGYTQKYSNQDAYNRSSCSPKRTSKSSNAHQNFNSPPSSSSAKRRRSPSPYDYVKSTKYSNNHQTTSNGSNKNEILYIDEDEKDSTRTLFIGNLDNDITEDYLRSKFKSFGYVDSVDIKRDQLHGNSTAKRAYAFVKFENMLMAVRAKRQINGRPLFNGIKCKIGFGELDKNKT